MAIACIVNTLQSRPVCFEGVAMRFKPRCHGGCHGKDFETTHPFRVPANVRHTQKEQQTRNQIQRLSRRLDLTPWNHVFSLPVPGAWERYQTRYRLSYPGSIGFLYGFGYLDSPCGSKLSGDLMHWGGIETCFEARLWDEVDDVVEYSR